MRFTKPVQDIMFSITVSFRSSRSRGNSNKPGIVFYRIASHRRHETRIERCVNSDIQGTDESILQIERERIISQIRLLYCIIEKHESSGSQFSVDDVVKDFREALIGAESMTDVIEKSRTDFPFQQDLVSVCRNFKRHFKFIFVQRSEVNKENMFEYILNLSQVLKNENRNSLAKNYLSLLSSLRTFVHGKDIDFMEIDREFILHYAEWLTRTGISDSTQSFYLRNFRAILNKANRDGLIGDISGWFYDVNTQIHFTPTVPERKLDRNILLKIENLDLNSNESLSLVRDMFIFGFYCGGMELVDVAYLTEKNIKNGVLSFHRRLKGQIKKVLLGSSALNILNKYACKPGAYLFPLLDRFHGILFSTVQNYVAKNMKEIGQIISFPELTFGMNILAFNSLISSVNISELLLKHDSNFEKSNSK